MLHGVTVLGAITVVMPPHSGLHYLHVSNGFPLSRVGSRWDLGGLSMPILAILFITSRIISQMQGGLVTGMQGDDFASEPGGIMEVAVWLCLPLLLGP